jgi:hypothetical protein
MCSSHSTHNILSLCTVQGAMRGTAHHSQHHIPFTVRCSRCLQTTTRRAKSPQRQSHDKSLDFLAHHFITLRRKTLLPPLELFARCGKRLLPATSCEKAASLVGCAASPHNSQHRDCACTLHMLSRLTRKLLAWSDVRPPPTTLNTEIVRAHGTCSLD